MRRRRSRLLAVVALLATGCVGGGDGGSRSAGGKALATLKVFDQQVDIATGAGAGSQRGSSGKALVVGNVVSTDAQGFGEIDYVEGSLVRLDRSTSYVVTKLVRADGVQQTTSRLDVGRSWHQVKKLTGSESAYEVDTPNAVAAVQGTTFMVDCRTPTCVFTVVEGVVSVRVKYGGTIAVRAGQSLSVPPPPRDGTSPPVLTPTAADLARDVFALRNHNIDTGKGSAPTAAPAVTNDRVDGVYDVTQTITSATGYAATRPHARMQHGTWTITAACIAPPCKVRIVSDNGFTSQAAFDGSTLVLRYRSVEDLRCVDADTGRPSDGRARIVETGTVSVRVVERSAADAFAPGPPVRLAGEFTRDIVATGRGTCGSDTGHEVSTEVLVRRA